MENPPTNHRNDDYPKTPETVDPIPFPDPRIHPCRRINTRIYDTLTDQILFVKNENVVEPAHARASNEIEDTTSAHPTKTPIAYWIKEEIMGVREKSMHQAVILRWRHPSHSQPQADWETTTLRCAIKIQKREHDFTPMKDLRVFFLNEEVLKRHVYFGEFREIRIQRWKEVVKVEQYLKRFFMNEEGGDSMLESTLESLAQAETLMARTHLMMPVDHLSDGTSLYSVMPLCGGDLFYHWDRRKRFTEAESRELMRNILHGLQHLQLAGVCHRDLSLENVMMDRRGNVVITEFGTAQLLDLRADSRLLTSYSRGGKVEYMSPEILYRKPFDGYAGDLWAVGVMLFMMLTGSPPWERVDVRDGVNNHYEQISQGGLRLLLGSKGITGLSDDVVDLLQHMFWHDPAKRMSLGQVLAHPWMQPR